MEYRVEELASRAAVSVDTIRFYQGQGLLPLPERRGRLAWYRESHLERLTAIRELRAKGLTLSAIRRVVDGELSGADLGLAQAVAGEAGGERLTLADLAART